MAKTLSTMLPLGTKAPQFKLIDSKTNKILSLNELKSEIATVVMFICNHCPYVIHIKEKLAEVAKVYSARGISFIGINSNDIENYPADSPAHMKEDVIQHHYTFPYLFDETQEVARAYQAACTPDFYIFNKDLLCVYRGRFDASTPGNGIDVTGEDLTKAIDAIIDGRAVGEEQHPSMGCNIKWK